MKITDVIIHKVKGEVDDKLLAYVTVNFDDCFVVHNIKIIKGMTGIFLAMPNRKTGSGEYKDVAHPITPEFRAEMHQLIMDKYAEFAVSG